MEYTLTSPCDQCPFLKKNSHAFSLKTLMDKARGEFPCHKTAEIVEYDEGSSEYRATKDSLHCAGALIFNELRHTPHQMMRICERIGLYDHRKLNMDADVQVTNAEQ